MVFNSAPSEEFKALLFESHSSGLREILKLSFLPLIVREIIFGGYKLEVMTIQALFLCNREMYILTCIFFPLHVLV